MEITNHQGSAFGLQRGSALPAALPWHATTWPDRILLFALLSLLPLEDQIPTIAGRSAIWILFLGIFSYIVIFRFGCLLLLLPHRFFVACYLFLLVGSAIESFHVEPNFEIIVRLGQMTVGALLVAALCRDERAFRVAVWGYLAAGLWLALWLFLNDYANLRGMEAATFDAANQIRATAFEDKSLAGNLNAMAFFCAQGALAALVLTLAARKTFGRIVLAIAGLICLVGSFLPLSRSGILCALAASAAVLWAERSWNLRYLILILFLGGGIYFLAPQASLVRATNLSFQTRYEGGKLESRGRLYAATVEHLPEFFWLGVGCGNFYDQWGLNHGFVHEKTVAGTHNSFFEITMYWGLFGLASLMLVVWVAYRCVPGGWLAERWGAFLLGLFICLFLRMLTSHNLYAKEFSLGFGLLAGASFWIWPRVSRADQAPGRALRPVLALPGGLSASTSDFRRGNE